MRIPDVHQVDGVPWRLRRAWPRGTDVIAAELSDPQGLSVVARWFADRADAAHEHGRTPGSRLGDDPRLLLQPGGADRRLPRLASWVAAGGSLVAHRPGRRAVVRTTSRFVKFTRAGRAPALAARHETLAAAVGPLARVPTVLAVDDDLVTLEALPGRAPLELAHASTTGWEDWWRQASDVLVALVGSTPDPQLPTHDAEAEATVVRTWLGHAQAAGRLPSVDLDPLLETLLERPGPTRALAHRDLHDGQLLVDDGQLGLLDPDTLAAAEPELDLANLLVHLDLRVDQGSLAPARRDQAVAALSAATADLVDARRLAAYAAATRLRLAAVYAFRPRWATLTRRWLDDALAAPDVGRGIGVRPDA